jgi:tRNA(Arg) A34 adenosine deaminase TadA
MEINFECGNPFMLESDMTDKDFLKLAIKQGKRSVEEGGFPAGAVVVKDGKVIAEGVSLGWKLHDPTEHAETSAIKKACNKVGSSNLGGATLYESLECCNMCFSVSNWAGISKIVYACRKTPEMVKKFYYEGSTDNKVLNDSNNQKIETVFIPDYEQEVLDTVKAWEEKQK